MPVAKVALRAATAALAAAAGARAQDADAPGLPALAANAPWWTVRSGRWVRSRWHRARGPARGRARGDPGRG